MTSTPDISVIVLVYEQPRTLEWQLASLARQDFGGTFEVIVCDDGSRADMRSVVEEAADAYGLDARFISQPHIRPRLSRARNNGIRLAQGDALVFLDGDIVVPPDFLRRHLEALRPRTLVCGHRRSVYLDGQEVPRGADVHDLMRRWQSVAVDEDGRDQAERASSAEPWMACLGCNLSVMRAPEIWFDERFIGWGLEDAEYACRLVRRHGYALEYVASLDVLHVELRSREECVRGRLSNSHAATVQFIRNNLCLRSLYPDVDVSPMLRGLLYCFLDPRTDQWSTRLRTSSRHVWEVIAEAEDWFRRRGISLDGTPADDADVALSRTG